MNATTAIVILMALATSPIWGIVLIGLIAAIFNFHGSNIQLLTLGLIAGCCIGLGTLAVADIINQAGPSE